MADNKDDRANKEPSPTTRKVVGESFEGISKNRSENNGKFVVNQKKQPIITQSCATPPRPIRGDDK